VTYECIAENPISHWAEPLEDAVRIFRHPVGLKMAGECLKWCAQHERDPQAVPRDRSSFAPFLELGSTMAYLVSLLHYLHDESEKRELLDCLVWKRRGRRRKALRETSLFLHGQAMRKLWEEEMQEPWNRRVSLGRHGRDARPELERRCRSDVVESIYRRRATPESSLARVYSRRVHISVESARNALLYYRKARDWQPAPQV
jgi:hypothetical protein